MSRNLSFSIPSFWDEIEGVRKKINFFLSSLDFSDNIISKLTMVASELVENAVKFGYYPDNEKVIDFNFSVQSDNITMSVKNPIQSKDHKTIQKLFKVVENINLHKGSIDDTVTDLMVKNNNGEESGRGLIRIAFEGESKLTAVIEQEDCISVAAEYTLK